MREENIPLQGSSPDLACRAGLPFGRRTDRSRNGWAFMFYFGAGLPVVPTIRRLSPQLGCGVHANGRYPEGRIRTAPEST